MTRFDVSRSRSKTAGQVRDEDLAAPAGRAGRRLHPASRMMIAAVREALDRAGGFAPGMMVIGTTSGGMSFGERFHRSLLADGSRRGRAAWVGNYAPQKAVLDAQEAAGLAVPTQIIANACASGTNAIGHAFELVRSGECERVLCGGYDALSELVFVGFDCLQASTTELCRPFDKDRTGLVLGEGAAILALESEESASARGAEPIAVVTGYGISTDNHHLTQPHPSGEGPFQAMSRALASARREPSEIDYVNAHGTATAFNDSTEAIAISRLLGAVPVSSTKSMMGHALGAAGAIEAVFCLLAIEHQFLPPNIHFRQADPDWKIRVVANEARPARVGRVMSNSFGFGGTNATLVLERPGLS